MRFILDALGLLGRSDFDGTKMPLPGKAVFQSPSGQKVSFDFEDLSSQYDLKAAVFESASGDGTYVQPNGHTSGRFPMAAIFHGDGYDKRAEAFLSAVLEPGVGQLTHPQYRKPISVVPVGTVDRFDGFKSGANQTIYAVTFYETTGLLIGGKQDMKQSFDSLLDASAADFSSGLDVGDVVDRESFLNKAKAVVKTIKKVMKVGSQGLANATEGIENVGDSINRGIDLLVGSPLTMARQIQILIGEPARQADLSRSKLAAYGNLASSIFGSETASQNAYTKDSINTFHLNSLVAKTAIGTSALLAVSGSDQFETKADYLYWADFLKANMDTLQEWNDNNYVAIATDTVERSSTDIGGGGTDLLDLVARAISDLITGSFEAKNLLTMELASERTPIDLAYELYGSSSHDTLDLLARTNNFGGDEYFLLKKGRRIVWYV